MRFHKSFAALLAASISISGCSPFQRDQRQVDGSFRTAPTAELMTMAERYERQGDYAHAARLYEELLKGDPSRTQVRTRLQALAMHGVVSPQAQDVLNDNLNSIVAEHQRQLAEVESQREIDRHLASMTPVSTPDGYQLVDPSVARGVARVETPAANEPWTHETVAVTTKVPQSALPETEFEPTFEEFTDTQTTMAVEAPAETPVATPANEVPAGPDNWHQTVIRPQDDARRQTAAAPSAQEPEDTSSESRAPISRVVSSGSRLWNAVNEPATTEPFNSSSEAVESTGSALGGTPDWASADAHSTSSEEIASLSHSERFESAWRVSSSRADSLSSSASSADPFCDPIVAGEEETATATADECEQATPDGAWIDTTQPMQRAQSAFTLWQVSGNAEQTVPALIELLEHENQQVVEVACYFLGELGPAANLATAPLQSIRQNADETTSILAAEALSKITPSEVDSVEHIVHAAQTGDDESRLLATITLGGVDRQHESLVVPVLVSLLNDQDPQIRSAAALSLGGWGPAAACCTVKLEELALGDTPEVSDAARIALECIEK